MFQKIELCLAFLVCSAAAFAQPTQGYGAVLGTVRDPYGDGIPDTKVVLTNDSLGFHRDMMTTDDGLFSAPYLTPARGYVIAVIRKGFGNWTCTQFEVKTGEALNFQIPLRTGSTAVRATAASALLPISEMERGITVDSSQIQVETLPSNGRQLDPLTVTGPYSGFDTRTGQVMFLGESTFNQFYMDGVSMVNGYFSERPDISHTVSEDAIREAQTYVVGAPGEYGRMLGGAVNAGTRSGSNFVHGDVYGYIRVPSLGSASKFAAGLNLLQKQNQEGVSIGAPVVPKKVFLFVNAELLDGNQQDENRILNPLITDSAGTVVSTANCKATAVECAAATKMIQPQLNIVQQYSRRWETGLAKIDIRATNKDTIYLEANAMGSRSPAEADMNAVAPNGGLLGLGLTHDDVQLARVGWTRSVFPWLINNVRVSTFREKIFEPAAAPNASTGTVGLIVAGSTVGDPRPYSTQVNERRDEVNDTVTVATWSHTLVGGGGVDKRTDFVNQIVYPNGLYTYPSLTALATDLGGINQRDYTSYFQTYGTPSRGIPLRTYNAFAQDTWRPLSNLTIIAGVRWDKYHMPQPIMINPNYYQTANFSFPNLIFAPRFGAALAVDPKTVVRLNYSWFYSPFGGNVLDSLITQTDELQTPILTNSNVTSSPLFPKPVLQAAIPNNSLSLVFATTKFKPARNQQGVLAIERQVARNTLVTLSGIDARGYRLLNLNDVNFASQLVTESYAIQDATGATVNTYNTYIQSTRADNTHSHAYQINDNGSTWYRAGSLELRQQAFHGLTLRASYTFSRTQTDVGGPLSMITPVPLSSIDNSPGSDKGNAPTDQKHRVVASLLYAPQIETPKNSALGYLVNGWQISAIGTFASGLPETPTLLLNGQQFSAGVLDFPSNLDGSGGWNRVPFETVGSLKTGRVENLNMRFARSFTLTDVFRATAAVEAFNLLNNQYITCVNTIAYTATTGVLKPVAGVGLGNAAQGSPYGTNARSVQVAFRVTF